VDQTIRAYIKRRVRLAVMIGVAAWALGLFAGAIAKQLPEGPARLFAPAVGTLLFGAAILFAQRIKCPKCKTSLRPIAVATGLGLGLRPVANFCPYCGVSLDSPMPHATAELGNPIHPA
jgi:hypothetical protein